MKSLANRNFDETVEAAFRLGVDPRKADQMIRGTVSLPARHRQDVRVAVFAAGRRGPRGRGGRRRRRRRRRPRRPQVEGGFLDFDVAIATPDLMGQVGKLGRTLGPRGLMPNPKTGTVTNDVGKTVAEFKARQGRVPHRPLRQRARADRQGQLRRRRRCVENYQRRARRDHPGQAGVGQGPVHQGRSRVSSTMGPGVKIDPDRPRTSSSRVSSRAPA